MSNPSSDFVLILETMVRHQVDFIVIDGVCAVLHGAPRTTLDLDLVHSRGSENLPRFAFHAGRTILVCDGRFKKFLVETHNDHFALGLLFHDSGSPLAGCYRWQTHQHRHGKQPVSNSSAAPVRYLRD
jgi:hypothetical protein